MGLSDDFSDSPVPNESKQFGWGILFIWMGFILVVASMAFGGGLAGQLDARSLLWAILIGNVVLAALAFFTGYVGSKSGLSFALMSSYAFGGGLWRIAVLYVPLTLIGWYAIESAIFASLVASALDLSDLTKRLIAAAAALMFSVSAYLGVRFMGILSYVLVPLIILGSVFALGDIASDKALKFGFSGNPISLADGVSIVVSTWIFSVFLAIPDLTRFVRNPLLGGFFAALGVFVANSAALGLGAWGAATTGQSDPSVILISLGFVPVAILLSLAGIWSTNDNNMYSSSLGVSRSLKIDRKKVVVGLAAIGAFIALFDPSTMPVLFAVLVFMGSSAPPLGSIVFASFLLGQRYEFLRERYVAPWAGWIGGTVMALSFTGALSIPVGVSSALAIWFLASWLEARYFKFALADTGQRK